MFVCRFDGCSRCFVIARRVRDPSSGVSINCRGRRFNPTLCVQTRQRKEAVPKQVFDHEFRRGVDRKAPQTEVTSSL